jgi:predicted ATP-dependent endonuclease of OLD family
MYKSIHLNSEETKIYNVSNQEKELSNLSKINIFIGPNNSGKSKFLRALFSNPETEFKDEIVDLDIINKAIGELKKKITDFYEAANLYPIEDIHLIKLNEIPYLSFRVELSNLYEYVFSLLSFSPNTLNFKSNNSTISVNEFKAYLSTITSQCLEKISSIQNFDKNRIIAEHIYTPTLRGLRGIDYENDKIRETARDNYKSRTKEDYFKSSLTTGKEIYTGLSLYNDVKKLLLGSSSDRKKIREFEAFISKTFFDNQEFSIIPSIRDNVVHVKIGDEDDRPIYSLGEGVQSIIILTYPLFFNKGKNICIFYEEPDMFLHPGFQRIFIETLNKFPEFQFFMTTHSNHFLDMTLDFNSISVYTFQKNEKREFIIENVKNDDNNILELLGVKNSSIFLSNCTIWVEGITDRIYLRKYLELYQKTKNTIYSEDIHFSFVEYGGGNITHWSFLEDSDSSHKNIDVQKLCGKLFLISDQDGAQKNKKAKRHIELDKKLKERYYCLKAREIENLLPANAIISTLKALNSRDCEKISFQEIIYDKYKNEPLGEYIDKNVKGLSRKYKADSGTIKYKVEFAKASVSQLNDFNELTDEAKSLTKKLYNFIQKNNPK